MDKLSKIDLLQFIDFSIAKGLVNANTGGGWKAACNKILEDYGPSDNISGIDVPSEVIRYSNRHPGALSPNSLSQYQSRVSQVLSEFAKHQANPTTYKGSGGRPAVSSGKTTEKRKQDAKDGAEQTVSMGTGLPPRPLPAVVTDSSLVLPFPLRPTFLAQVVIPRDLTKDEADRLCAFIQSLGQCTKVAPGSKAV